MKNFALLLLVLASPSYASVDDSDAEQTVLIDGLADNVGYASYVSYVFSPPIVQGYFFTAHSRLDTDAATQQKNMLIRAHRTCQFLNYGRANMEASMILPKPLDQVTWRDDVQYGQWGFAFPGYNRNLLEIDDDGIATPSANAVSYIKYLECRIKR